jgi:hypothetical protein
MGLYQPLSSIDDGEEFHPSQTPDSCSERTPLVDKTAPSPLRFAFPLSIGLFVLSVVNLFFALHASRCLDREAVGRTSLWCTEDGEKVLLYNLGMGLALIVS